MYLAELAVSLRLHQTLKNRKLENCVGPFSGSQKTERLSARVSVRKKNPAGGAPPKQDPTIGILACQVSATMNDGNAKVFSSKEGRHRERSGQPERARSQTSRLLESEILQSAGVRARLGRA